MCQNPGQGTLTRRQDRDLFDLRVKLPLVTNILTTKGRGNPAAYLQLKEIISELVCLSLHYLLIFNIKQENCNYQLFTSFVLTRQRNQIQVYRLRGGRSNY